MPITLSDDACYVKIRSFPMTLATSKFVQARNTKLTAQNQHTFQDLLLRERLSERRYRHWLPGGPIGCSGPPDWNHARLHLACINLLIFNGIYLDRPSGNRAGLSQGANAGSGAGRAYAVASGRGRSGEVWLERYGDSRTRGAERSRSASTHAMRLQFGELC
eukprot:4464945-Pleurochrysis_carterae.AAC.8